VLAENRTALKTRPESVATLEWQAAAPSQRRRPLSSALRSYEVTWANHDCTKHMAQCPAESTANRRLVQ
jgi:hypothetical protein